MKALNIVAIEHTKCDQYSKTEYWIAPEGKTDDSFHLDVQAAQTEYLLARKRFEAAYPKPRQWIEWVSEYTDERNGLTDGMTIAEAKRLKAKSIEDFKAWHKARDEASGGFQDHLRRLGYRTLYETQEEMPTAEADWGHHHGEGFQF